MYNSKVGIQAYLDNRADSQPLVNDYVHDNKVIMTGAGLLSLSFADYGNGQAASPASGNHGSNNVVWYPASEAGQARFQYGGTHSSVTSFAATVGGTGTRYLSDSEKSQALTAAGITP